MISSELADLPSDAARMHALRRHAARHGAILGTSHRFSSAATWWADVIRPGYGTVATGPTQLDAAMAAIKQFDSDVTTR
jgi:hypothetical protein